MQSLIDYLKMCLTNNLVDVFIAVITVAIFYLLVQLYITHYREAFDELLEATIENNIAKAIRSMRKCPAAINYLHPLDGYSPFMRACLHGNTQLVNIMLKSGANITLKSSKGETPFHLAICHHIQNPKSMDSSCIRALYYAGCDINCINSNGFTALQLAANFGHIHLVKWLLTKGASTTIQPYPYAIARSKGHLEVAELLENMTLPALETANN